MIASFKIRYEGQELEFPDLPHHIPRVIRATGTFYELDLLEHLRRTVRRGGTWVDVGANIGNHTLFFSRYTADGVVSLEPHPDTFAVLMNTVRLNGLTNVRCLNVGASDRSGASGLGRPEALGDDPGSFGVDEVGGVSIRLDTLNTLLAAETDIRLIKIDVEGHEEHVVRGSLRILEAQRPDLVVEAHTDEELGVLLRLLAPLGYRVLGRWASSPTYHLSSMSSSRFLAYRLRRRWRHLRGLSPL